MTKKNTFKPIFLYHDAGVSAKLLKQYREALPKIQTLKNDAEKLISRKLSTKEKELVFMDKNSFVANIKDVVSAKFNFPDSPLAFNLASLGLSYEGIEAAAEAIPNQQQFIFNVDSEGNYELLEAELKRIHKAGDVFTTNENQNTAVKQLENIVASFNALKKVGLHFLRSNLIQSSNGFLTVGENDGIKLRTDLVRGLK